MIPNNNLSVLPWYDSLDEQNARRWWVYDRIYPLFTPLNYVPPFQLMRENRPSNPIREVELFTAAGEFLMAFGGDLSNIFKVCAFDGYDVIVYVSGSPFVIPLDEEGQFYLTLTDGVQKWYSDVFTVVGNIASFLKLTWWDDSDFVMDAGRIVYTNPSFRNELYLQADIAKPEYIFEEEGETRDGYFFPVKQISEKRYRFSFLASEYLLDVMRFIRMADHVKITYHGQQYSPDTFLLSPEWESNGDVAAVEAEFDTATVAKRIGRMV